MLKRVLITRVLPAGTRKTKACEDLEKCHVCGGLINLETAATGRQTILKYAGRPVNTYETMKTYEGGFTPATL